MFEHMPTMSITTVWLTIWALLQCRWLLQQLNHFDLFFHLKLSKPRVLNDSCDCDCGCSFIVILDIAENYRTNVAVSGNGSRWTAKAWELKLQLQSQIVLIETKHILFYTKTWGTSNRHIIANGNGKRMQDQKTRLITFEPWTNSAQLYHSTKETNK